jgi:hypothetical protein
VESTSAELSDEQSIAAPDAANSAPDAADPVPTMPDAPEEEDALAPADAGAEAEQPPIAEQARRGLTPSKVLRRTLGLYGASTVALAPIWEPERMGRVLRAVPAGARSVMLGVSNALHQMRTRHTLACLLSHEVMTDVTSDLLAQSIGAWRSLGPASKFAVDWQRVPRSTTASLLSDDFPFLIWSRYLWDAMEHVAELLRASALPRGLVRALSHPLSVALSKTAITQLVYESVSNLAYLAMQAAFRGGGRSEIVAQIRGKFFSVWVDGLLFWSAAHMVVFLMPIWWLQPIADNLFTLVFNTYLSTRAYESVEEDEGEVAE